jgi:simple sugar transport system substrate-binding protein
MGDGASFGMIQAVEDHNAKAANKDKKVWFIDVIGDKRKDHGDALLTSVLFDYTPIYNAMIDDIEHGTFGKVYTMDVKNGGVRLLDLPDAVPQNVKEAVAQAQQQIVDGKIKVSAIADAGKMKERIDQLFPK